MTVISNIDENGINRNLRVRYDRDTIYVSAGTSLERLSHERMNSGAFPTKE